MLGECYNTETRSSIPNFDFTIICTCDYPTAIWRVCESISGVEMALLLQYIRFGLPLPYKKLAELRGTECKPFARFVYTNVINIVL